MLQASQHFLTGNQMRKRESSIQGIINAPVCRIGESHTYQIDQVTASTLRQAVDVSIRIISLVLDGFLFKIAFLTQFAQMVIQPTAAQTDIVSKMLPSNGLPQFIAILRLLC